MIIIYNMKIFCFHFYAAKSMKNNWVFERKKNSCYLGTAATTNEGGLLAMLHGCCTRT